MSENTLSDILSTAVRSHHFLSKLIDQSANLLLNEINLISCFRGAELITGIGKDKDSVVEVYFNGNEENGVSGWFKTCFYGDGTVKTLHSTKSPDGGAELVKSQPWNFSWGGYGEREVVGTVLLQIAAIDPHGFARYLKKQNETNFSLKPGHELP